MHPARRRGEADHRPVFQIHREGIILGAMETSPASSPSWPLIGLAVFAIVALLLAALAGWAMYGTSILFTYAQNGLAWCL